MLVLSRKEGEAIFIGEKTTVIVGKLHLDRGTPAVKLAIQAPPSLVIRRAELDPIRSGVLKKRLAKTQTCWEQLQERELEVFALRASLANAQAELRTLREQLTCCR